MPSRPPVYRPAGWAPDRQRLQQRKAPLDARRGSAASRGYDGEWRKLRLAYLAQHPLCVMCDGPTPATVVDHIISIAERPDLRLDWSNLRPLCKRHHDQHTAREQGMAAPAHRHPDWLKPSLIPLVIVCGPPASGKTTYVRNHAGPRDMVIDLDVIGAELDGSDTEHGWDRKWLKAAIRERNKRLGTLCKPGCGHERAWLIVSEPKAEDRQWWADKMKPERIVVLEVSAAECMRRVRCSGERDAKRSRQDAVIGRWWETYQRREGDHIIRC
jgi:hypothetical protein